MKHHTSKLREFSDLLEVETFGFRGEALSSLCSLSNLSIITRHSTSQHAFELEFDKNGVLIKKKECARQQGTTVYIKNIFKNLPVRAKEFEKNIKKEFTKMIQVLYSYCLVSAGVKITCTNTLGNKSVNTIVSTNGVNNVLDNITSVFGRKMKDSLIEIEMQPPDKETLEEYNLPKDICINFKWKCFVSSCSHTLGRSSPDRQFFYVNGRPCDPIKISKLINHTYHKYNNKQYPFVYFNIQLDQSHADVNVTPDKRTILFTQEQVILATIKSNFERTWKNTQGIFTVKTLEELNFKIYKRSISDSPEDSPPLKRQSLQKFHYKANNDKEKCTVMEDIKAKISKLRPRNKDTELNERKIAEKEIIQFEKIKNLSSESRSEEAVEKIENKEENSESEDEETYFKNTSNMETLEEDTEIRTKLPDVKMTVSIELIKAKLNKQKEFNQSRKTIENRVKYRTQLDSKASDVEKELEKELTKTSFKKVCICFCLIFIKKIKFLFYFFNFRCKL